MTTLDMKLQISDDVLNYLRQEAHSRNVSLDVVVSEVLADYFAESTKEEVLAGNYRPTHDALDG